MKRSMRTMFSPQENDIYTSFIKKIKYHMKTLKIFAMMIMIFVSTGMLCVAQHTEVTIVVKGITEAKGKIMVAAGDKSKQSEMVYDMVEVTSTDNITCTLKNVPVGTCDLFVFQDLNDNYQLDMDENKIPVEPCYNKEKVKIKEEGTTIEVKLLNVKEMMGK